MTAIGIATSILSFSRKHRSAAISNLVCVLVAGLWTVSVLGADAPPSVDANVVAPAKSRVPDSKQLEGDLQHLPWKQFRSVIESVPKMKADVEAYGPAGWKYVEASYRTYGWKKGIDKLDDDQKQRLAELIRLAKGAKE